MSPSDRNNNTGSSAKDTEGNDAEEPSDDANAANTNSKDAAANDSDGTDSPRGSDGHDRVIPADKTDDEHPSPAAPAAPTAPADRGTEGSVIRRRVTGADTDNT